MGISLITNSLALTALRRLDEHLSAVSKVTERLSSGQRINKASDDAASLAIASNLRADSRVFGQGMRNIQDGISVISIAEGALTALSAITTRQLELAAQAANGTYTDKQRLALHKEAQALTKEFNRIIESTTFNGERLFGDKAKSMQLQAGYGSESTLSIGIGEQLQRTVGDGSFGAATTVNAGQGAYGIVLADFNRDGNLDLFAQRGNPTLSLPGWVALGNGDGTFGTPVNYATNGTDWNNRVESVAADLNRDGLLDLVVTNSDFSTPGGDNISVLTGNGDGTFDAPVSYATSTGDITTIVAGDFNGDGKVDIMTGRANNEPASILLGNGDGSLQAPISLLGFNSYHLATGDFNEDSLTDVAGAGFNLSVGLANGSGSFTTSYTYISSTNPQTLKAVDFNLDGHLDLAGVHYAADAQNKLSVWMGYGDGSFAAPKTFATGLEGDQSFGMDAADINGDGYADLIIRDFTTPKSQVMIGNGDGSFTAGAVVTELGSGNENVIGDVNNDGVLDYVTGLLGANVHLGNKTTTVKQECFTLYNQAGALSSLTKIKATLERVNQELGSLGAQRSRLETSFAALSGRRDNYLAAEHTIMDADIAQESADRIRHEILMNTTSALLAQASQQSSIALKLLA